MTGVATKDTLRGDRCDFCEAGRRQGRRVRHYHRVGSGLIVMDAVPASVCDQCGHRYFDAEVVKEMERLSRRRSRLKDRVSYPRVRFTQVGAAK